MDLGGRARGRKSGFTLIELMVVLGVIGILAAVVIPPWATYRSRLNANSAAQGLRGELVRLQAHSIAREQICTLRLESATLYAVYHVAPADIGTTTQPVKRGDLSREGLQLNPSNACIVFGPRGWVDEALTTVVATRLPGGFRVFFITVSAPGVATYTVNVHLNGKVNVQ